jgi:hypothetical protein
MCTELTEGARRTTMAALARRKSEEGRVHALLLAVPLAGLAAWGLYRHWSRQTHAAAGSRPYPEAESLHSTATEQVGLTRFDPHHDLSQLRPAAR